MTISFFVELVEGSYEQPYQNIARRPENGSCKVVSQGKYKHVKLTQCEVHEIHGH
jgi:hypothetical protein